MTKELNWESITKISVKSNTLLSNTWLKEDMMMKSRKYF